jgi:hypothetical protein
LQEGKDSCRKESGNKIGRKEQRKKEKETRQRQNGEIKRNKEN